MISTTLVTNKARHSCSYRSKYFTKCSSKFPVETRVNEHVNSRIGVNHTNSYFSDERWNIGRHSKGAHKIDYRDGQDQNDKQTN